jgi:DNA-binding SARP family transcriptional activator
MLALRLLGPPDLAINGKPAPPELLWRKHLALLAYLALSPKRARTREHLVGLLWGEKDEAAARHSLREAIRVLRQGMGAEGVEADGQLIRILPGVLRLDTDEFAACVAREAWSDAVALVAGDFLEGFSIPDAPAFEDWLSAQRLEWRERTATAMIRHAEACLREGRLDEGRRAAGRALAADALSDLAVQTAMRAEALAGDLAAALEIFATFVRRTREAGGEPGPATRALADRVRATRVPAPAPGTGRRESWSRRAPLVGRGQELAEVQGVWERVANGAGAGVVIVEGDLGIGKTRLLEEATARVVLAGGSVARALAVRADRDEPGAGLLGLARGGLVDAPGIAAAPVEALAAFAGRLTAWGDRFPAARAVPPLSYGAAFREIVTAAVEDQPLLLAVDEAHWLDGESLATLHAAATDARNARLLILLTILPGIESSVLDEIRSGLGNTFVGSVVSLTRLAPVGIQALAAWALPKYQPDALERITRRVTVDSAGLPLLAIELLHAVSLGLEPGDSVSAWPSPLRTLDQTLPAELPDSIIAAVRVGFRGLSHGAQQVLAAMAVLPERAPEDLLERATGLPAAEVRGSLDELEWQRWVTAECRGYTFVARIVKDIVKRDMLTAGQRRRIEEAVGGTPPA